MHNRWWSKTQSLKHCVIVSIPFATTIAHNVYSHDVYHHDEYEDIVYYHDVYLHYEY